MPFGKVVSTFTRFAVFIFLYTSFVFFMVRYFSGDPARLILGDFATEEACFRLREKLALNEPMHVQYIQFFHHLCSGHWGESLRYPGVSVADKLKEHFFPTFWLAFTATSLGAILGVGGALFNVGPWYKKGTYSKLFLERGLLFLSDMVSAIPLLCFAPMVTWIFCVKFALLPLPSEPGHPLFSLLYPAILLSIPLSTHVFRFTRVALLEVKEARFISVVRAKGASPFRVWFLHALRARTSTLLIVLSSQFGALLGGAVLLERMVERKGLGTLILQSYASRDLPVLEASILLCGFMFISAQSLSHLLTLALDPRARA